MPVRACVDHLSCPPQELKQFLDQPPPVDEKKPGERPGFFASRLLWLPLEPFVITPIATALMLAPLILFFRPRSPAIFMNDDPGVRWIGVALLDMPADCARARNFR